MRLGLTGLCRGEGRAYAFLEVPGESEAHCSCVARLRTSAGGELPAELYALCTGDNALVCTVVSFPLFTCESATLLVHSIKGGALRGEITITQRGLALRSRANALLCPSRCADLRGSETRSQKRDTQMQFVQVFEGESSRQLLRLHIVAPQPCMLSDIVVYDGQGLPLIGACTLHLIEPWHAFMQDNNGSVEAVVSIELPCNVVALTACVSNTFSALDEGLLKRLVGIRDDLMINPGIDPRYRRLVSVSHSDIHDDIRATCNEPNVRARREDVTEIAEQPLFSIVVPLFQTPPVFLRDMIESVLAQSFSSWELILVNASPHQQDLREIIDSYCDVRIRELSLPENQGIASNTNAGIRAACGKYIAFLDHDDMLESCALAVYAEEIAQHQNLGVLYCDEDSFTTTEKPTFRPLFKPQPNRSLLYSHNYFLHFLAVSRSILEQTGLADEDTSGAQDYDLVLKACETACEIHRVPKVLYHWRMHEGSTNGGVMESKPYAEQAAIRSLERHFKRRGLAIDVRDVAIPGVYCIDYRRIGLHTQVSMIVLATQEQGDYTLLTALAQATDLAPIQEIIVVTCNNEVLKNKWVTDLRTQFDSHEVQLHIVQVVSHMDGVDFAQAVNAGVSQAIGDIAVVCSNVVSGDLVSCVRQLAGCLARSEVGVVAPKLLYADGLVQHVGLCVRGDATLGYLNQNFTANMGGGYHGIAECSCDYSALGPDCWAVRTADFQAVGAMTLTNACAEVEMTDFCFKIRTQLGGCATVLPDAVLFTRALVLWQGRNLGFTNANHSDIQTLWNRWGNDMRADVLAHPYVELTNSYFHLKEDANIS